MKVEILDAAESLLIETADESAVSVRAIADRVGVTPPSIYRHFADKDALMMAVCNGVFARLDEAMEKAAAGTGDPLEEIRAKGRAYIEFGLAHPEHYRILFMLKREHARRPEPGSGDNLPGAMAFIHLQETIQRVLEMSDPDVPRPDEYAMTCSLWTAVHGITSLRIGLPDFPWPSIDEQLDLVVEPWRRTLCPAQKSKPKAAKRPARRPPARRR